MMKKITVAYGPALSNISYRGQWTFLFDEQEWDEADIDERQQLIREAFAEWILTDVDYEVVGDEE